MAEAFPHEDRLESRTSQGQLEKIGLAQFHSWVEPANAEQRLFGAGEISSGTYGDAMLVL